MSSVDTSDTGPESLIRAPTRIIQAACAVSLVFLIAAFSTDLSENPGNAIIGALLSAAFCAVLYKAWPRLLSDPGRDGVMAAGIGVYVAAGLIYWPLFSANPWSSFAGLAGSLIFLLAVLAGWKEVRKAPPTALFGIAVIFLYVLASCLAPILAPYSQSAPMGGSNLLWGSELKDGGIAYLGTDQLGRDILSRLLYGARNTVGIAFVTTALTFVLGSLLGLLAASMQGWIDQTLSRVVDVLMAIPQLIFALVIFTVIGSGAVKMIIVIALLDSTRVFRLSRSVAMSIVVMDYVEAAKLRGERLWYIIYKEVLPNATAPLAAEFGLRFCFVFLFISALSFLGIGLQPPTADWGAMVRESANLINFFLYAPAMGVTPLLPAFAIALLTVAVNFVVDWFLHKMSGLKE